MKDRPGPYMNSVAVLGAGAGGLSSAVEFAQRGYEVRLWARRAAALERCYKCGVRYCGALGEGCAQLSFTTTDLGAALLGAEVVVVCLPGPAHAAVFEDLARLRCAVPIVLSPGQTGGALHIRQAFGAAGVALPPTAELSTLPYVARLQPDGSLFVSGRARQVRCGVLPGGEGAAKVAAGLFWCSLELTDVLGSSLSNVNMVLHPPGAVLAAAWVEATAGDFTFYVEAMTPGVARVLEALDAERTSVGARFGHELPSLVEEMALIGTVPVELAGRAGTASVIRSGEPNRAIKAPSSLEHRYYREDFAFGLVPFLAFAKIAGVATPVAEALVSIASALLPRDVMTQARTAEALGIAGCDMEGLGRMVHGGGT
jgi:opine dehydrogenase